MHTHGWIDFIRVGQCLYCHCNDCVSFLLQTLLLSTMNKMKNFKRRFSLSVPRTETIEENEFTEQINQLNIRHTQGTLPILCLSVEPHSAVGHLFKTLKLTLAEGLCQGPKSHNFLPTLIPDRTLILDSSAKSKIKLNDIF